MKVNNVNNGILKDIILIEDDKLDFEIYSEILNQNFPHIRLHHFDSIESAKFDGFRVDTTLIILDISIQGQDGISFYVNHIKKYGFVTYIHTSSDNPTDVVRAKKVGLFAHFQKKSGHENIAAQFDLMVNFFIENYVKELNLEKENDELVKDLDYYKNQIYSLNLELAKLRSNSLYPADENKDLYNDELFIKIAKSLCVGIYIFDLKKKVNSFMNCEYKRITGYTIDEINSMSTEEFTQTFHPEDIESIFKHMGEIEKSKMDVIHKIEYRFKHKDGHWIKLLSLDKVFECTKEGKPISFIGSFFQI